MDGERWRQLASEDWWGRDGDGDGDEYREREREKEKEKGEGEREDRKRRERRMGMVYRGEETESVGERHREGEEKVTARRNN